MKNYFDHLIIDEAQDIMEPNNIMILSSLLKKGFNENKLTIFGDFEWQSLYDFKKNNIEDPLVAEHEKLIHEKLSPEKIKSEYCNDLAILTPRINCRNTPSVSQQAEMHGGMNPGYRRCLRNDDGIIPLIKTYKNRNEQLKLIIDVIGKLKKEKYENHEIVMLSFTSLDESVNSFLNSDHEVKFLSSNYTDWKKKGVVFCTSIRSFKGLESPVVIVTDIPGEKINEKISKSLLYTGITRSIDKLILLVNDTS